MKELVRTFSRHYLYGSYNDLTSIDSKVIFIPRARDILLNSCPDYLNERYVIDEYNNIYEQIQKIPLKKYFFSLREGRMNAVEILFTTPAKTLGPVDPIWSDIQANRHRLVAPNVTWYLREVLDYLALQNHMDELKDLILDLTHLFNAYAEKESRSANIKSLEHLLEQYAFNKPHLCRFECSNQKKSKIFKVGDRKINIAHSVGIAITMLQSMHQRCHKNEIHVDWPILCKLYRTGTEIIELMTTRHLTLERPDRHFIRGILDEKISFDCCKNLIQQNYNLIVSLQGETKFHLDVKWQDDFVCYHYADVVRNNYGD